MQRGTETGKILNTYDGDTGKKELPSGAKKREMHLDTMISQEQYYVKS